MKEFIIRGLTADFKSEQDTHTINFSGHKGDYGFKLIEFTLYPSTNILSQSIEVCGIITAGKTVLDPENPDFSDEGLIGSVLMKNDQAQNNAGYQQSIVNDLFVITQDIILSVTDTYGNPINWQCKFMPIKLSSTEAALTNYRQFSIFDE
jgi:hypothetical protein